MVIGSIGGTQKGVVKVHSVIRSESQEYTESHLDPNSVRDHDFVDVDSTRIPGCQSDES